MSFIEVYFNSVLRHTVEVGGHGVVSIGRTPDNSVSLDNKGVSSHHAIITQKENTYFIEDINSTNGTFVNGQRVTLKQPLSFGDSIDICKHTLKFVRVPSSDAVLADHSGEYDDDADSTIIVPVAQEQKVAGRSRPENKSSGSCYLLVHGELRGVNKLLLDNDHYSIGKAKYNDLRVGGWFTAKKIAEINLVGDNYYLTVLRKGKVKVNGMVVNAKTRLSNDDNIKIKKKTFLLSN